MFGGAESRLLPTTRANATVLQRCLPRASIDAQVGCALRVHPFQLMSEPIRRRILEILASGEHTAGEVSDSIVSEFGVTPSAVSRHLRILRENHAVIMRAEWVNRLYRLDVQFVERLKDEVHQLDQLWRRRYGIMGESTEESMLSTPIPRRVREGDRRGHRAAMQRDDPWWS